MDMRKKAFLSLLIALLFCSSVWADDITGFWQTIDSETKKPSSVIAVYPYQGKHFGRIIAIYNDDGTITDTMYNPKKRSLGMVGDPYTCGLDIVWNMLPTESSGRYKGTITDPSKGKIYKALLWRKGNDVILRGEVFIFGKSVTWPPFPEEKFNKNFKKPDISTFVPVIHAVK